MTYNTAVVLAGVSLLGACAGVIGCFAVLRRRSLTGDALAHAALPGLCLAYLIVGQRSHGPMMLAALLTGLLGIAVISALRRWTRTKDDAAIGIVLSVFFGVGIVLTSVIQRLPGGHKAGLASYTLGQTAGLSLDDVYLVTGLALGTLVLVVVLYKEFRLIAFDQGFARVQGWPALRLDLLLMALIALAVVIGLPAVGVLLIAALLIIPGAAARFWTDRLGRMLLLSALFGVVAGVAGALISDRFEKIPTGPCIVLVGTGLFLFSLLFAPRRGLLARFHARKRLRDTHQYQRLLCTLHDLAVANLPKASSLSFEEIRKARSWSAGQLVWLLRRAERQGDVVADEGRVHLTEQGGQRAARLAQRLRLWQEFLQENPELAQGLVDLDLEAIKPEALARSAGP